MFKKINFLLVIFLLVSTYSCIKSPGLTGKIKKNLKSENIKIKLINLNSLNIEDFNFESTDANNLKVKNYKNIYSYKYEYILGPGDVISLNLTDTDELDKTYLIEPDGSINLPFIGKIKINDLTQNEAAILIEKILSDFYKNPELQLIVEEFNSSKVYVVGAVNNQLTIELNQKPIKLLDAAIKANFNPTSLNNTLGTKGFLRRDNSIYEIDLDNTFKSTDAKENFYLKKNDVIFIDNNSDSIQIFGEVNKPGIYFKSRNLSITELVSQSGINQLTSNAEKIYILRERLDKYLHIDVFIINLRDPVNLLLGNKFKLMPKDIVYIPPQRIVKWNRVISLLLPQTDLFNSYNPIIQDGVKNGSNVNVTE